MAVELGQLIETFEKRWPLSGAEEWDAPGLIAGNSSQRISRVLLSVDVTDEIITEAYRRGWQPDAWRMVA